MYIPGVYEKNFDDYLEMISQYIRQYRILKLAIAYDEGNRVLNFNKNRPFCRARQKGERITPRLPKANHPFDDSVAG